MNKAEYLKQIDQVIEKGRYKAEWSSLAHHKVPDWFTNAKFGIFIHWGVYSVPAFDNEWYPRSMYTPGTKAYEHHIQTYGSQKTFGYKDFIPQFKAEKFHAQEWVQLFKQAGAKYVVPVAEHHDGFAMYDTAFNRWNAAQMGPCRNVIGELKQACDENGLVFCASTHRAEHFFFMNMGRTFDSDVNDPAYQDFYGPAFHCPEFDGDTLHQTTFSAFSRGATDEWMEDWLVRTCELIDLHKPQIVYFDWWIHNHSFKPYLKKLAAYYYNRAEEWGKEVTINYKHEAFPYTVATFDVERGALTGISPLPWQTDTAIGKRSWGYTTDNEFKGARQIVCDLIDIVSKNGNLLLNIGPKPDGTITDEETGVLLALGKWLEVNGEGIYSTTFWKQFGEGEVNAQDGSFQDNDEKAFTSKDFRFTYKDGYLYAFQMRPDENGAMIRSLYRKDGYDYLINSVTMLGNPQPVAYERTQEGLRIHYPMPKDDLPVCFKIEIG